MGLAIYDFVATLGLILRPIAARMARNCQVYDGFTVLSWPCLMHDGFWSAKWT